MKNNKKKNSPTIYDIAKIAGVSPGTVSRTLNNIGYIKDETRAKIEKVIKELNYIPNRAARTLKTKKTGLLLLAIPDTDNPFYFDLIKSVQDVAKFNEYSMVLYYTDGSKEDELKALKMMHENFADGIIMVNFNFTEEYTKEMEKVDCPIVLSGISVSHIGGRENDRFDYVGVDTEKGLYLSTRHLIMQGHTEIGYIAGVKSLEVFQERYRGYYNAHVDSGLEVNDELVFWKDYTESSGYEAGKYFLSLGNMPTAVCTINDLLAVGAMRAFEEEGIRVPEDISLVGMDNIDMTARIKPKLSTVAIAQSEIGRTAAELIFKRLNGKEKGASRKIIFQPRLVVRESSIVYNR